MPRTLAKGKTSWQGGGGFIAAKFNQRGLERRVRPEVGASEPPFPSKVAFEEHILFLIILLYREKEHKKGTLRFS